MRKVIEERLEVENMRYGFLCIDCAYSLRHGHNLFFIHPLKKMFIYWNPNLYSTCRKAVEDMAISSPKGFCQYKFLMKSWHDCKADMLKVGHWACRINAVNATHHALQSFINLLPNLAPSVRQNDQGGLWPHGFC